MTGAFLACLPSSLLELRLELPNARERPVAFEKRFFFRGAFGFFGGAFGFFGGAFGFFRGAFVREDGASGFFGSGQEVFTFSVARQA